MNLNITESKWQEYERKLKEAYEVYYKALQEHGLNWYLSNHPETTEDLKNLLKALVAAMPKPEEVTVPQMIVMGIWGTCRSYEYFYTIGKDGPDQGGSANGSERALYDLSMLTHSNEDPIFRSFIEAVWKTADFAIETGKILGKYGHW